MSLPISSTFGAAANPPTNGQTLESIAGQLDALVRVVERYGSISASAPLFVAAQSGDKNPFNFAPGTTSADHFRAALQDVQAGQRISDQTQFVLRAGATGQFNATGAGNIANQLARDQAKTDSFERGKSYRRLAAEKKKDAALAAIPTDATDGQRAQAEANAEKAYYEDLAALEETTPGTGTTTEPPLPDLPASGSLAKPAETGGLLPNSDLPGLRSSPAVNPVLSHRSALVTAAGDTATQAIFSILGDTEGPTKLAGKKTLLGAMMVNVEPGWGTEEDFIAEVSITAAYRYRPAREPVIVSAYLKTNESRMIGLFWRSRPQLVYATDIALIPDEKAAPTDTAEEKGARTGRNIRRKAARDQMKPIVDELTKNAAATLSDALLSLAETAVEALRDDKDAKEVQERWMKALDELDRAKGKNKAVNQGLATFSSSVFVRKATPVVATDLVPADLNADILKLDRTPLATAVSPMTDAQNLDFDSTIRKRVELSLSLAAAFANVGQKAQAEVFSSFAKQLQSDIALRTNQSTITAFSHSGGVFGYRIGPQLDAVFAPKGNALKSKAQQRLKRTTFPSLIMVTVDETHLGLQFRAALNSDRTTEITPVEPVLELRQVPRWTPLSRPREGGSIFWWRPRRLTQSAIFASAAHLVVEQEKLKAILEDTTTPEPEFAQADFLNRQVQRIAPALFGSVQEQRLPEDFFVEKTPDKPIVSSVASVSPNSIKVAEFPASGTWSVVLTGENLNRLANVQALNLSFAKMELKDLSKTSGRIEVTSLAGGWPKSGTVVFQLTDAKGADIVFTPAITIQAGSEEPTPEVTKAVDYKDGQTVETYKANTSKGGAELIEALIKRDIPVKSPDKVTTPEEPAAGKPKVPKGG